MRKPMVCLGEGTVFARGETSCCFRHNDLKNEYARHFFAVDAVFGLSLDVHSDLFGINLGDDRTSEFHR
jgi:hypothetical protein